MTAIKVFVSYSWSTVEHENWVLELATQLVECGVDIILDKWDLKEGEEANAFMERMVSDPEISKVVIISDQVYAQKSNSRKGGAGTEAQIISQEIFSKRDETKFVAVVTEKDVDGKAFTPAYYTSRIFIDFSDESKFADRFEQLLRWIADKPLHKKPALGSMPSFLVQSESTINLPTNAAKRRALDALTNSKTHAFPATKEYFELFSRGLELFRFEKDFDPLSEEVLVNFESFIQYRDEWMEIVRAIANYTEDERFGELIHAFFERLVPFFYPTPNMGSYSSLLFDNFKFFGHEMLLHSAAVFINEARWDLLNILIEKPYYSESWADRREDPMGSFKDFRSHLGILEHRQQNLGGQKWLSPAGQMLQERVSGSGLNFHQIMQADFILFLRAALLNSDYYGGWWPDTLVYLNYSQRTFEEFERARSAKYYERIRPMLGNATKDDLVALVARFNANLDCIPRWEGSRLGLNGLIGVQNLCTRP